MKRNYLYFRNIILLIWILFAGISYLSAGDLQEKLSQQWRWNKFDNFLGLPGTDLYDILESDNGQLWIIAADGMSWFDGYVWQPLSKKATPKPLRKTRRGIFVRPFIT